MKTVVDGDRVGLKDVGDHPDRQTTVHRHAILRRPAGLAVAGMVGAAFLLGGCLGAATGISGEIRDDAIILATDHAGPAVRLNLTNKGTVPCHLAVVIAPMPVAAMPITDGQVAVDTTGRSDSVRPALGGDSAFFHWVQPGERYEVEVALEGAPTIGERVVLCNERGGYQQGRYTSLTFDR